MWIDSTEKCDIDLVFTQSSGLSISDEKKCNTKRKYFITYQSYFSIEINAHSLKYLTVLVSEGKLPIEALHTWLQNSQTCGSTFRSARSISSINSAGVNFTVAQFLSRINKLITLQTINNNSSENKLRFPQHHKLSSTTRNAADSSNITIMSKTDIKTTVLNAYSYAINLFKPLKIKQLLRNGKTISVKELSNMISRRLEDFWATQSDDSSNKNQDLDTESGDETDSDIDNDLAYDYESDEEKRLDDNYDTIHNVNASTHHGIRLVDNVKEEFAHSYFQIIINGDKKYLHKQAACWILRKDRGKLSSDRLSRVQ
ncbi:unnamed protein product, partial [Rotaria sp. Silwood1]